MPDLKWMRYGNWCGPGPPAPADPESKTPADNVCRTHDMGYRQCGVSGLDAVKQSLPGNSNPCTNQHDKTFVKQLEDLIASGETKGRDQIVAHIMSKYFKAKLKFDKPREDDKEKGPGPSFKKWLTGQDEMDPLKPG